MMDKKFSKSFKQMIANCLVKDPSKRFFFLNRKSITYAKLDRPVWRFGIYCCLVKPIVLPHDDSYAQSLSGYINIKWLILAAVVSGFVDTCNTKRVCGSDDSALPLEAGSRHQKSLWFGWFNRAPRSGFESVGDLFFVSFLPT
ncbi:hypothetical protein L1987_04114 [Smallanthus sonchifolius]|uniref:Uncharacterized protein n=1 Tax=Smallanthus sonchifolius TaxID=185202 RepID=A0ACB9KCI3_9ASTR|nr:hypothetical protein L1987_04114 [Smallanthus sonchifolius]